MLFRFIRSTIRFRWAVLFISLIFLLAAGKGLERIQVLSDYKSFLDPEYPGLLELEHIEAVFSENHNLLIAIAPQDGKVFKPATIKLIQDITAQAWLLPHASRVDSITNYQHTEAQGDDLSVGDLLPENQPLTAALLKRAERVATTEPSIKNNLIGNRLNVAVVSVTFDIPDGPGGAAQAHEDILASLNRSMAEYRKQYPDTRFYITGVVTVDYALGKYGKQDSATLIPAMLGLMALMLLIMTRSFSSIFAAGTVVIFTGLGTMGLLGWSFWEIDPGSAVSPIVIMTLAVADSIHIIEGMQNAMRNGMEKFKAIEHSLKENFLPVFLTSLTTVLGVITFSFADFPSLRRLGITVALGVTIAFILSITLLPALLAILPMKVKARRATSNIFNLVSEFVISHYRKILIAALLLSVGLSALLPLNTFNDSPRAMLASYTEERQAIEFFEDNVSGILKIDIAVFTDRAGAVNDPKFLATIERFTTWLEAYKNVDHVSTLTDTFKRLNQNMHGDDPDWYKLPEQQDLAAQYLLLYEMSLPYGLDLNNQLDIDKSAVRMTAIIRNSDSQQTVELKQAIEQWFAENAPQLRAIVTGTSALISELSYLYMIPSMMKGGSIAILMVSLVLFIALRSFKLGFLGMLANILPVSMGYGLWYLINGQVNFAVASVAGVCLGVVVDFAVHFLNKYQKARVLGDSVEDSIRFTFSKTGRPLWTTTIVLVAGFWLLMLSPITLNSSMGLLTGIIILIALAFDFLVLPSLLLLFNFRPNKPNKN